MAKKPKEYKVKDLIIDDQYDTITSDSTIFDAANKMKDLGVPDLVVLDTESKNVLGVIGDFDIVKEIIAMGLDPAQEKVTTALYSIEPVTTQTPVREAFDKMQSLNVNVIPVIEDSKLLGVCSIQDCWSYLPDENVDEVGMIPVNNPRNAEFWFAGVCSLIAFVFGIVMPLAGVISYFKGSPTDLNDLFGMVEIRGTDLEFFLFEAHGSEYFRSYFELVSIGGAAWVFVIIGAFCVVIFGIIGLFSIIYASYSMVNNIRVNLRVHRILPLMTVGFMILQWVFFGIAFAGVDVLVNPVGLILSIISMILMILAAERDYIFRQAKQVIS